MERFTISRDENRASEFDRLIRERGYLNCSGAVCDMNMCTTTPRLEPI